jgi:hypothetical protein
MTDRARELALSVKAQALDLIAAGQAISGFALADVSSKLADAVLDLAGDDRCPTCGARVRVVSSDEGTAHYEPGAETELAALREAASWLLRCKDDMNRGVPVRGLGEAWEGLRAALNPGAEG